jgi:eukaryotic-like serine/threonine-protein kinase
MQEPTFGRRLGTVTPSLVLSGRYRVNTRIGLGGMSEVWQATDEVLDRSVAIKVLATAALSANGVDPTGVIRAEAQAAARLSHPNVASVYDFGEGHDESGEAIAYIVMELLSGQSLGARLAQGPIDSEPALRIMADVAAALAAAHAIGVVHRDVKPGNIMLTPFGAKVFDFGIAASTGDADNGDARGRILGTPSYVAPERLSGARVTPAADMYAFGVLLTRLFEQPEEAPSGIDRLRRRCLAADPQTRPTAHEAHAVVQATLGDDTLPVAVHSGGTRFPGPALPPTDFLPQPVLGRTPVRRWSLVATAALLVAAGLSCLAVLVEHGSRTEAQVGPSQNSAATPRSVPAPPVSTGSPTPAGGSDTALHPESACQLRAQRGNDLIARFAKRHERGRPTPPTATVVCRNGVPIVQLSR